MFATIRWTNLALLTLVHLSNGVNLRPIIGVLTQPTPDYLAPLGSQYLVADYVKWLESSGARVVPVHYDASVDELKTLFSQLNGLLFTGGNLDLTPDTHYFQTAQLFYSMALDAYIHGDYVPIWGTCQGFQLLSILGAGANSSVLTSGFDSVNLGLSLNFTMEAFHSRLFNMALENGVFQIFSSENVTMNLHVDGVDPQLYISNEKLAGSFKLLSTNVDRKGRPFGSTIEHVLAPFYATQFHPERNAFEWDVQETALDHSADAIVAMQYLGRFFVDECRRNNHAFSSPQAEAQALIYNWNPAFTGALNDDYPEQQTYVWK